MIEQYKVSAYYFIKMDSIDVMCPVSYYGKPNGYEMVPIDPNDEKDIREKMFTSKIEATKYMEFLVNEYSQFMEPTDFYFSVHHTFCKD